MATILAHITVQPGQAGRFEEIAAELHRLTHEREPDVRRYEYWRGSDENTYYSLLSFDTYNDFLVHQTSEHHEIASPQLRNVVASIRLEWVDPLQSSSPLTSTEGEALPEDASDLMVTYAERFAVQVAPWWATVAAPVAPAPEHE
ncbi:MAG: antibiotic biosynthesis monooxygenase family protein [Ilumatobacteraceae bacterium]